MAAAASPAVHIPFVLLHSLLGPSLLWFRDEVFTALNAATAMILHADRILMPYVPYMGMDIR